MTKVNLVIAQEWLLRHRTMERAQCAAFNGAPIKLHRADAKKCKAPVV